MNAYEKAQEIRGVALRAELDECMSKGYVFVGPGYLLAGFRVGAGWFIRLAVGRGALEKFVELMPYRLEFIGWARELKGRSEVKWYPTELVLRKVKQHEKLRIRREKDLQLTSEGS